MRAVVKSITGFEEAFTSMFISKRNWTPELEDEIERICNSVLDKYGMLRQFQNGSDLNKFNDWLSMLLRMGKKHITVLRFIDVAIMTEGIHRAGQDDIDSHAKRFENKIIRSSTRLATFTDEMSDWYKDKIITTDTALKILGISIPEKIYLNGEVYIKTTNGYIKEEYVNNNDVKRGLYMLSIPSNFISKINLCEWAHVFKERNRDGSANPEVKQWAEMVMTEITEFHNQITRDYVLTIEN
ncbi:hypothetical protein [Enterocloster bolteae]|uniref:hypothetical protein n=1 Tax=Enterocloster bolteae TaxID=208479 RepID=UPI0034A2E008